MITVSVLVPVIAGLPESLITIGMRYSFCCSRSNDLSDEMTAIPSPLAPSESELNIKSTEPDFEHTQPRYAYDVCVRHDYCSRDLTIDNKEIFMAHIVDYCR